MKTMTIDIGFANLVVEHYDAGFDELPNEFEGCWKILVEISKRYQQPLFGILVEFILSSMV